DGETLLGQFARSVRGLGMSNLDGWQSFYNTFVAMDPDYAWVMDSAGYSDVLVGTDSSGSSRLSDAIGVGPVAIKAGSGNDTLDAGYAAGLLYAGAGNDILKGGIKARFVAGTGNSEIFSQGNDTIVYKDGDGNVDLHLVSNYHVGAANSADDTIEF